MRVLPQAVVATTTDEVLHFVDQRQLCGSGIGYVDAQRLASTHLTTDARILTRDRRLAAAAKRLDRVVIPGDIGATDPGSRLVDERGAYPAVARLVCVVGVR